MARANELVAKWPGWARANAETVLASPAWRMPVSFDGRQDALRIVPMPGDQLFLDIRLDETRHVLSLSDSPSLGDLHMLWSRRDELDPNLVLALVEHEGGALFQMLEDVVRRQLGVVGIAEEPKSDSGRLALRLDSGLVFSIDLTAELRSIFGDLSNIDPSHDSIRSMTRNCRAHYAAIEISDADAAALGEGDVIPMIPEYRAMAEWSVEGFADSLAHVCAAEETPISFAEFADGRLPPVPPPSMLSLVRGGRIVADGEISKIGGAECFRLTRLR